MERRKLYELRSQMDACGCGENKQNGKGRGRTRAQRNEEEGDRVFLKRREEGHVWMRRNKGVF